MTPVLKDNRHGSLGSSARSPGSGSCLGSLVLLRVTVFGLERPHFTYVSGSGLGLLEELGHLAFHTARWGILMAWWSPGKLIRYAAGFIPSEWACKRQELEVDRVSSPGLGIGTLSPLCCQSNHRSRLASKEGDTDPTSEWEEYQKMWPLQFFIIRYISISLLKCFGIIKIYFLP